MKSFPSNFNGFCSGFKTNRDGYFLTLYFEAKPSSDSLTRPNCNVFYKLNKVLGLKWLCYETYLKVLAESFVDKWGTFLGICEQKYFWSSDVFLDEGLVIIICDFDWFVRVESTSYLFQLFRFEFFLPFLYESFETALVECFPDIGLEMLIVLGAVISGMHDETFWSRGGPYIGFVVLVLGHF